MEILSAASPDGAPVSIPGRAFDTWKATIRGDVLTATDPGYDAARAVWNAMIDRRPAIIVRCLGVADVVASLAFAREHGVALSVRGGGHNISGLSMCAGGIVCDLSRMRGVRVEPSRKVAYAQTGCLLGDVDRETQLHGLAACLGFVSKTGIAGLTLGGGFGYLSRRFGWTSDTVRSMDVVTAEGKLVTASEKKNADLFWALRGGGGNFGIVTGIEYGLHKVGPDIIAGGIAWRGEEAPRVLALWRELMADAPPELTIAAVLRPAPPAPWLDPSVHGKPIVALFICHTGPLARAKKSLAAIKKWGKPVGDIVQRRPYASQQSLLDATQPSGRRYYWKSEYFAGNESAMLDRVADHGARIRSPHSAMVLFPIDGAINRLPNDHSAVGNRDAKTVVNATASWESPADDAENIAWAREAWNDVRPFSTGGTYINFLTEEEGGDRIRAAYGENYARLQTVKRTWDPQNFFRANKNIAAG